MKGFKSRGKGAPKGEKPLPTAFRLSSTTYFLTYKGVSDTGRRLTKQSLASFLLKQNPKDRKLKPERYLICQQMYDNGQPHLHAILVYSRRKQIVSPDHYDCLGIHPNVQCMRNMNAAISYVYKQDPKPFTNMDVVQQKRVARASKSTTLYQLLQQQMKKDPFNFDVFRYCLQHDLTKQIYKANYSKAISLLRNARQAYCNKLLSERPGFKYIDRSLIELRLSSSELQTFDSDPCFQTIVDHLNQIPLYRFRRPPKTLNLLITGPPSIGKSALVWQQYPGPNMNPLNSHVSVYPMGMKDWFPDYRSQVHDVIYWNQAKLTSYPYDVILQLLDGGPVMLPAKGSSHKKIDNPLVIMTSNMTLQQMIKQKFGYDRGLQLMAQQNLSTRVTNVVVPRGLDLFLLQRLLVPNDFKPPIS